MPEAKECVLKIAPDCPANGLWHIHYPTGDAKTVVYACGRCVGTAVRNKLKQMRKKPTPEAKP